MSGSLKTVIILLLCVSTGLAAITGPLISRLENKPITGLLISKVKENQFFRAVTGSLPTPEEIAKELDYSAETHTIKTPDGYHLAAHRVTNTTAIRQFNRPEPIILQHGLVCNSGQWVVLEPRQNLAFMLADAGYDVWLTNIRGNMYSRKHDSLSPGGAKFWDYGWHEHGTIDMPSIIDYILNQTGYQQTWYAGHSMGTTMFFVMNSLRTEYNDKIKHMFALAPVAYMGKIKSPVHALSSPSSVRAMEGVVKMTMNNHIPAEVILFQLSKMGYCSVATVICGKVIDSLMGFNSRSNATVQKAILRYMPDAASLKQVVHYAQGINDPDTFRQYDYYEQNMEVYKKSEPPDYPVERITAPMTFLYSVNDYLAHNEDVENFSRRLKNVQLYLIPDKEFNHMDYIIATYAHELVYTPMIQAMNKASRILK